MELPQQVMDVDAIPGSGLFFYFSSAADAVTMAVFLAETEMTADATTDADAKLSLSFCSSPAAVMAAASASVAVADANQQQFFSSCLKSRLCKEPIFLHIVYFLHIKYVNREKRSSYGL